jgi:hypothetical protein
MNSWPTPQAHIRHQVRVHFLLSPIVNSHHFPGNRFSDLYCFWAFPVPGRES